MTEKPNKTDKAGGIMNVEAVLLNAQNNLKYLYLALD